ncbi:unnamed protein product [Auanema sp. JU1783]|nr:unnamed protein product [Auanema sp. JU1783]
MLMFFSLTTDFLNSRSRVKYEDDEERIIFLFDYRKDVKASQSENPSDHAENANANDDASDLLIGEEINWRSLQKLKRENKWGVMRHPMILNFLNEQLINCAMWYTVQILMFAVFLLMLSFHILSENAVTKSLLLVMLLIFFAVLVSKAVIKKGFPENNISSWFLAALTFNMVTYSITVAYLLLPEMFTYDNYNEELKKIILWLLPIVAILSAWLNFLYILRKSPYGIYTFMMVRILKSFGHIATIWIPTLIAFSFAFHLIMRDSGIEPWDSLVIKNATVTQTLLVVLQAITKTSTMMIGEVDANDILGTKQWIPSCLVLAFEIITVILLMNLMVSLAVGDVSDLRNTAEDTLLRIKVNFIIEYLQILESYFSWRPKNVVNNILVVHKDGSYFTTKGDIADVENDDSLPDVSEKKYDVSFINPSMRMTLIERKGRPHTVSYKSCFLQLRERLDSGIPRFTGAPTYTEEKCSLWLRYAKWLIGINWTAFLEV